MDFKNLVAFCVLMQSRGGICGKSPDYIAEKFHLAKMGMAIASMDSHNKEIYNDYITLWNATGLCDEINI